MFDADWYVSRYHPKLSQHKTASNHFVAEGGASGLSASPRFISAAYLAAYPDVARSGLNPLIHYLRFGKAEGKQAIDQDELETFGLAKMGRKEQRSVATLAASDLFDQAFYLDAYPEVRASGLHPLLHYVRNGLERALRPGPRFDAERYIAENPGVFEKRLAPLVDYEWSGRRQAGVDVSREPATQSEAAGGLRLPSGRLFDAAWYLASYPDVARSGVSPAEHYARYSGAKRRKPGPLFDPDYYLDETPDAAGTGAKALLHYLDVGRAEGRAPLALLDGAPPADRSRSGPDEAAFPSIEDLVAAPAEWRRRAAFPEAADVITLGGEILGQRGDGGADLAPLVDYCRLVGLDPVQAVNPPPQVGSELSTATKSDPSAEQGALADPGPVRLADAWHASERTLRLRFERRRASSSPLVIRGFQGAPDGDGAGPLALCLETALPSHGPGFVDLPLRQPFAPALLAISDAKGVILTFVFLPFPSLARGGLHHAEAIAAAESAPGDWLRYGADLAEELASGREGAIGRILVRRQGATGAEAIFSPPLAGWLAGTFGVSIELEPQALSSDDPIDAHLAAIVGDAGRGDVPKDGLSLVLPADAIPTLAALAVRSRPTSERAAHGAVRFVVAAAPSGEARFLVALPQAGKDMLRLQPASRGDVDNPVLLRSGRNPFDSRLDSLSPPCLAIYRKRFAKAHDAQLIRPTAPDAEGPRLRGAPSPKLPNIAALLMCDDAAAGVRLIESLAQQEGVGGLRLSIRVVGAGAADMSAKLEDAADRHFADRYDIRAADGDLRSELFAAATETEAPYLLVARSGIVAHDRDVLSILGLLLDDPGTASAGCVVVQENVVKRLGAFEFRSGGYFPEQRRQGEARIVVSAPDTLTVLPNATYPVIANQFDFLLLRRDAALALGEPSSFETLGLDLDFGVRNVLAGRRNLCTSAVRVVACEDEPAKKAGPASVELGNGLDRALATVTLLQELGR